MPANKRLNLAFSIKADFELMLHSFFFFLIFSYHTIQVMWLNLLQRWVWQGARDPWKVDIVKQKVTREARPMVESWGGS